MYFISRINYLYACFRCVSLQSPPSRSVFRNYETVIPKSWKHVAVFQINRQNMFFFLSVATSHGLIAEFRFLTTADISFSVSTSHQLSPVLSSKLLSKWGGSRMSRACSLYKSVWLGCFYYFFNIPSHTPIMYTLKTRKFTLKRLKTHNICSYMFRSIFLDYFQGVRGQYFMQLLSWDRLMYARFTSLILHILLTL